jgi:hypothetical protein
LIKTLFKKIVHNKNDIFTAMPASREFAANLWPRHTTSGPSILELTSQAGFLQYQLFMTVREKCRNSGLQIEYKVVYNQPIAVTPA